MLFSTMTLKIHKKSERSRTLVAKVSFRMSLFEMQVEFGWESKCRCTALVGVWTRKRRRVCMLIRDVCPQKVLLAKRGLTGRKVGALSVRLYVQVLIGYFVWSRLNMQCFMDFESVWSGAHDIATFKGTCKACVSQVGFLMFCKMTVCSVRISALLADKWTLKLASDCKHGIPLQYG